MPVYEDNTMKNVLHTYAIFNAYIYSIYVCTLYVHESWISTTHLIMIHTHKKLLIGLSKGKKTLLTHFSILWWHIRNVAGEDAWTDRQKWQECQLCFSISISPGRGGLEGCFPHPREWVSPAQPTLPPLKPSSKMGEMSLCPLKIPIPQGPSLVRGESTNNNLNSSILQCARHEASWLWILTTFLLLH